MRNSITLAALLAVVLWTGGSVLLAHHSTAAYDRTKPMTLQGTVTEIEWVNPHAWIHMDVKDASGNVTNWAVELGAPNALIRRGVTKQSISPGTVIVVNGHPARDGSSVIILNSATRQDGTPLLSQEQ